MLPSEPDLKAEEKYMVSSEDIKTPGEDFTYGLDAYLESPILHKNQFYRSEKKYMDADKT